MWVKLVLLLLFALMIVGAVQFAEPRASEERHSPTEAVHTLRLMTWNIGYAELEDDTRAHDKDLPAVAELMLPQDPHAVSLQALTSGPQLNLLISLLKGKYRGGIAQQGKGDRFEAVLVKDAGAKFIPVPVGARYALGASFQSHGGTHEVLLLSAHADAFNAAQRRTYTEALIDWAQARAQSSEVFIA